MANLVKEESSFFIDTKNGMCPSYGTCPSNRPMAVASKAQSSRLKKLKVAVGVIKKIEDPFVSECMGCI